MREPSKYDLWWNEVHRLRVEVDGLVREWGRVSSILRICAQPTYRAIYRTPCPTSEGSWVINQAHLLMQRINELREVGQALGVGEDKKQHWAYLMGVLDECEERLRRVINEEYLVQMARRNEA
jgi:hypothetical protein